MNIPTYLPQSRKSADTQRIINEALYVLNQLGVSFVGLSPRRLERMGMAFLAVAGIRNSTEWATLTQSNYHPPTPKTRDIIAFINSHFEENISPGSYDDIRRKDLLLLVETGIVRGTSPNAARNDPTRAYLLSPDYQPLIGRFGEPDWQTAVRDFMQTRTAAQGAYGAESMQIVKVELPDGTPLEFSPGAHNHLQKAVIEEFLSRFGFGAQLLYVGDTADKFLFLNQQKLQELKFFELSHGELPDILAYSAQKNWLYVIEAVHSSGPITPIRLNRLKRLTADCTAEIVYVTAFLDRKTFRKFAAEIAWETEVWIAEESSHLIHFDGEKFLGSH